MVSKYIIEELLGIGLAPAHLSLEELDVDGEDETMVGLDPHQFAVGVCNQSAQAVGQPAIPASQLPEETHREAQSQPEAIVEHVHEHVDRRVVAPTRDLLEVAAVHAIVEQIWSHRPWLRACWDNLRRKVDTPRLMEHAIGDKVLGHDRS